MIYQNVEDYIELLAGYDPADPTSILTQHSKYKFNLARYDIQIVDNMATATLWNGKALTDKQGELAIKLVNKYRRQFNTNGIDITSVESNPSWRMPLRTIDRQQRIWIDNDQVLVKFPYNQLHIEKMRELKDTGMGSAVYDQSSKVWQLAITEYNINFVVIWGKLNNFDIDDQVNALFKQIIDCENSSYEIKLVSTGTEYKIINAAPSLIDYINNSLGGFGLSNGIKLIDYAGVLGYTHDENLVRPALLDVFKQQRQIQITPTQNNLDLLFSYAELTNRFPICIYDPGLKNIDLSYFDEKDIVRFGPSGKTNTSNYNIHNVKVVYANSIPSTWNYDIPLLITTQQLLHGGKRMEWVNRAEKIVYYCNTLLREPNQ